MEYRMAGSEKDRTKSTGQRRTQARPAAVVSWPPPRKVSCYKVIIRIASSQRAKNRRTTWSTSASSLRAYAAFPVRRAPTSILMTSRLACVSLSAVVSASDSFWAIISREMHRIRCIELMSVAPGAVFTQEQFSDWEGRNGQDTNM